MIDEAEGKSTVFHLIIAVVVILLALAGAPRARAAEIQMPILESPFCVSESVAEAMLDKFITDGRAVEVHKIGGDLAAGWLESFNTGQPPITDYKADVIWIVSYPDTQWVLLAFFLEGKTCRSTQMPLSVFLKTLRRSGQL